jgi:hypothetical protein
MQCLGPVSYMVKVQDQLRHVHVDHLISGTENYGDPLRAEFDLTDMQVPPIVPHEVPAAPKPPDPPNAHLAVSSQSNETQSTATQPSVVQPNRQANVTLRRNLLRHCGAPKKLDL